MGNYAQKSENFVRKLVVPKSTKTSFKKLATKFICNLQRGECDLYLLRISKMLNKLT